MLIGVALIWNGMRPRAEAVTGDSAAAEREPDKTGAGELAA